MERLTIVHFKRELAFSGGSETTLPKEDDRHVSNIDDHLQRHGRGRRAEGVVCFKDLLQLEVMRDQLFRVEFAD